MGDRIRVQFNNDKLIKKTGYIDGYVLVPYSGYMAMVICDDKIVNVNINDIIVI